MGKIKALVLLSGGLDSSIALKLMLKQGLEVEAVNFTSVFCRCNGKKEDCGYANKLAGELNVKLHILSKKEDYLEIIKHPKHGYGSNLNPCIDCRIYSFRKSGELMEKIGASFIVTGEVLNQRPMSQHLNALKAIEKESGLKGLVLRPLSAAFLPETIPEKEGWVKRDGLLAIKGRGRKDQIRIAEEEGIKDFSCPAGGCLLTDRGFSDRLRDLMKYKPDFNINDVVILKYGRHHRLDKDAKLIVGRNEQENNILTGLKKEKDYIFGPKDLKGPVAILTGSGLKEHIIFCAGVTARYSDNADKNEKIKIWCRNGKENETVLDALPVSDDEISKVRL